MADSSPEQPVTVVTGATGKLGRRIVEALLGAGHVVVAGSRRPDAFASHPALRDGRLVVCVGDLADETGYALAKRILAVAPAPTGLVNNAVDLGNQALPPDGRPDRTQWGREFDLAVAAPYELTMALAEAGGSRLESVVNVSSMYAVVARNPSLYEDPVRQSPIHYGVAKAAMLHLTRELAVRLAPAIRVNAVAFGGVEGRVDSAFLERYARLAPQGRMLREDETPGPILFLLSEAASGMTGHTLVADGGWSIW